MVHTCPHCQEPHIRHLALRWASRESPAQCPGCGRLSQVLADTSSAIAVFTWLGVLGSVVLGLAWDSIALSGAGLLVVPVEVVWTKRRVLEVYLNIVEFDEGVFGVGAAARHYFGVEAADLSPTQAARLAAVLPDPKGRSASKPSAYVKKRAGAILRGAETIRQDGRAACFLRTS